MPAPIHNINESVSRFGAEAGTFEEKWQARHRVAMACFDIEQLIVQGRGAFDLINRTDEILRLADHRGELCYDEKIDEAITACFQSWWTISQKLDGFIKNFEDAGFQVSGSEEFRRAMIEVQGILSEDQEFFHGEKLGKLETEARTAHAAGETQEFGRMGD